MNLFLIRHCQSEANVDKTIYRTVPDHEIKLSEMGEKQAQEVGQFLRLHLMGQALRDGAKKYYDSYNLPIALWSSPYLRTRQTSQFILNDLRPKFSQLSYREDVSLVEQQRGLFDGLDDSACQEQFPAEFAHYQKSVSRQGKFWAQPPQGESRFQTYLRVRSIKGSWIRDAEKHGIKNLIVVSHGVTLRCLIADWLHYPYEWIENEPNPPNGSIQLISAKEYKGFIFNGFPD